MAGTSMLFGLQAGPKKKGNSKGAQLSQRSEARYFKRS